MTRRILLGFALAMGLTSATNASDHGSPAVCYKWVTEYKQITTYECRRQAYTVCVTKYDNCGNPYQVHETRYRTVEVPMTSTVPVRKRVAYAPN